jgi:HEPN domain-containing protein
MSEFAKAMWRQARRDIGHASRAMAQGDHDWACLAAQQAAEKALKAVLLVAGRPALPQHNLNRIFDALVGAGVADAQAKAQLQRHLTYLTLAFGFSRYPDAQTESAPADLVTQDQAEQALHGAEEILAYALSLAPELEA